MYIYMSFFIFFYIYKLYIFIYYIYYIQYYIYELHTFIFYIFSIMVYHRILTIVLCAMQWDLVVYPSYIC